jgi:prepilin-type N-terminal cleavage/methylation domain-containing protein
VDRGFAAKPDVVSCILMPRRRLTRRGFTLAELMAVVVIIAVLASVGVTYFRRHALASKVTEAQAMVQSIRAAEERYRAENRQYLNVTVTLPTQADPSNYYPHAPDGNKRQFFRPQGDPDEINRLWWLLNPTTSGLVQFGYAVIAGAAGTSMPKTDLAGSSVTGPLSDNWYLIQALADNDGDHVYCVVVGTSLSGEVAVEGEGE